MLIVQAGLYFHASSIASAAAQEGARAATVQSGSIPEGRQVANDFVQTLAPRLLDDVEVDGRYVDGGELVRMTVRGDVTEVFKLPGVDLDFTGAGDVRGRHRALPARHGSPAHRHAMNRRTGDRGVVTPSW